MDLKINEDIKIQDTAAFMTNMEIRTEDGSQKPAADCSSGSYQAVLDSLDLNEKKGEIQQEQYPDMDDKDRCSDVDASLMGTKTGISEYKAEQPDAVLIDPEVDKEGQCEDKEDSGSLCHEHGDTLASVNWAVDREAASGRAGSETGAPTSTSPAASPSLLSCPSPTMVQLWFMPLPNKF